MTRDIVWITTTWVLTAVRAASPATRRLPPGGALPSTRTGAVGRLLAAAERSISVSVVVMSADDITVADAIEDNAEDAIAPEGAHGGRDQIAGRGTRFHDQHHRRHDVGEDVRIRNQAHWRRIDNHPVERLGRLEQHLPHPVGD